MKTIGILFVCAASLLCLAGCVLSPPVPLTTDQTQLYHDLQPLKLPVGVKGSLEKQTVDESGTFNGGFVVDDELLHFLAETDKFEYVGYSFYFRDQQEITISKIWTPIRREWSFWNYLSLSCTVLTIGLVPTMHEEPCGYFFQVSRRGGNGTIPVDMLRTRTKMIGLIPLIRAWIVGGASDSQNLFSKEDRIRLCLKTVAAIRKLMASRNSEFDPVLKAVGESTEKFRNPPRRSVLASVTRIDDSGLEVEVEKDIGWISFSETEHGWIGVFYRAAPGSYRLTIPDPVNEEIYYTAKVDVTGAMRSGKSLTDVRFEPVRRVSRVPKVY